MELDNRMLTEASKRLISDCLARYPVINLCLEQVKDAFFILRQTFVSGGKLLVCGNGGSAADAEHICGELMKGFLKKRRLAEELIERIRKLAGQVEWVEQLQGSLQVIPLTSNTALISAICNDLSADQIFAQQVLGYGNVNDALLAISTSGRSTNVIRAVIIAKSIGLKTIGLTGNSGGSFQEFCNVTIQAPADETHRIQELHLPIYHLLSAMLEEELFD